MSNNPSTVTHPLDAALAQVSEFPERLGPVLIKELRQGLRSGLFVLPFMILPAVLALVAVWGLSIDDLANARSGVAIFFWGAVIVPVFFITPLRALGAIRSERDAQTLELLQLTPLSAGRIVLAKWSSLMAQALLWVMALLPFFVLRYFFGGMNLIEETTALVWTVVAGAVLTAFAVVVSTMPRIVFWFSLVGMAFMALTGFWSLMIVVFSRGAISRLVGAGGTLSSLTAHVVLLLMAGHVTYLALAFAASRIAPLADNYAFRLRGGALALLVWFGLASVVMPVIDQNARWLFFGIAVFTATLVTITDLTMHRTPLLTQVRPWARLGPVGVLVGRAFLPGWPGAVVFFSGMTVLATAIAMIETEKPAEFGVAALVFWIAVMLPRAWQCIFSPRSGERPGLHVIIHLLGPVVAGVLAAFSFILGGALLAPAAVVPSTLWWLLLFQGIKLDANLVVIATVGALWFLGLTVVLLHHSRDYGKILRQHVATTRAARQP